MDWNDNNKTQENPVEIQTFLYYWKEKRKKKRKEEKKKKKKKAKKCLTSQNAIFMPLRDTECSCNAIYQIYLNTVLTYNYATMNLNP